ncbi:hypothetical protein [Paenibacillus lacisoli]|nr:hypothetical protein [Paenibacillus sp. JX-17]
MLKIKEEKQDTDIHFQIQIKDDRYLEQFKLVLQFFDDNKVYTDVLSYPYENHEYRVIVREDYYNDFLAEMLKARLLQSLKWNDLVL